MCKPVATFRLLLFAASAACSTTALAARARNEPQIGFLFPAGGRQGTTFEAIVGGQRLRRVADIYVAGTGVHASIVKHYAARINLDPDQRKELARQLRELGAKRFAELPGQRAPIWLPGLGRLGGPPDRRNAPRRARPKNKAAATTQPVELPDYPLLRNMPGKSLRQLVHVADRLLNYRHIRKRQLNAQLRDMVLIQVSIDADAPPGDRQLRLRSRGGVTNTMCFQVSPLPEAREQEPNDPGQFPQLPKEPPHDLPVVLNGQIMPGDVDRFAFRATRGQQLVIAAHARRLVPFLADAVPGWFQATLALYDPEGHEVAFADDYRFHPDPVLFYRVPADGDYELEIRDAVYRGRQDFVYRVAVGELPFITHAFPLGGRAGVQTVAAIDGWNLPTNRLRLNTQPASDCIRQTALCYGPLVSNEVTYAVDTLAECNETEPNNDRDSAQRVALPLIVNGRIGRPGDVDVFRFEGRAGDRVVAEVLARRLHSPLDSLLRVTDASGRVLEWNDDYMQKDGHLHRDMGLLTHHADSYLIARLPADGSYYVHLADTQNHGGKAHAYRLRISPPRVDFALHITPSSLSMLAGRFTEVTVHALRKDGFQGDIDVVLRDASAGFTLSGGRIPSGRDRVRMTLTAPRRPSDQPVALQLEGRAKVGGQTVSRPVVPADDVMQAFLYRHLVPSGKLVVAVRKNRWVPLPVRLAGRGPVRVPAGGTARAEFRTPRRLWLRKLELVLRDPPKGIALEDVKLLPNGASFQLKAGGDAPKPGYADNLIVEAFTEWEIKKKPKGGGKPTIQRRRSSLGILPAIPFIIVSP